MEADVAIEISKMKSDIATLAAEIVRMREALAMNNRGSLATLDALQIVKNQVDRLGETIKIVESWVGVPSD